MTTVPLREQPVTCTNARRREHRNTGPGADQPRYRVTGSPVTCTGICCLDREDPWPDETKNTRTASAAKRTAPHSRARSIRRATATATRPGTWTAPSPDTQPATRKGSQRAMPLLAPVLSHQHIHWPAVVLILVLLAAAAILIAWSKPTRRCPRCHGQRVQITRHWLTGRQHTRPCRRCSSPPLLVRPRGKEPHAMITPALTMTAIVVLVAIPAAARIVWVLRRDRACLWRPDPARPGRRMWSRPSPARPPAASVAHQSALARPARADHRPDEGPAGPPARPVAGTSGRCPARLPDGRNRCLSARDRDR